MLASFVTDDHSVCMRILLQYICHFIYKMQSKYQLDEDPVTHVWGNKLYLEARVQTLAEYSFSIEKPFA
jgi:hypothetical protein